MRVAGMESIFALCIFNLIPSHHKEMSESFASQGNDVGVETP